MKANGEMKIAIVVMAKKYCVKMKWHWRNNQCGENAIIMKSVNSNGNIENMWCESNEKQKSQYQCNENNQWKRNQCINGVIWKRNNNENGVMWKKEMKIMKK